MIVSFTYNFLPLIHQAMRLILALLFSTFFNALQAQKTYLHCGTLIDGISKSAKNNITIIIDGNKITGIEDGFKQANVTDKVVNLKKMTVTPGWIDMHVHLEDETSKNNYLEKFTLNPADYAFKSVGFAETTLLSGFTTVRDLGGTGVNISLRNAINNKLIVGPRVFTAGKSIATTGGHADPTNSYRRDLMGNPGPEQGVINGADDACKAVRQRYKDGADVIKITASGGVLSVAKNGSNPQFTMEELQAIISTANDYSMKVAAHAHGAEAMKRAIRAGVSSIEHGTFMDDEAIALFKKHGTYYVPTITAGKSVADSAQMPNYYPALVTPKALEVGPKIQATFTKAYKAGVKIAFGTDAGVFKHGKNWMEFKYMIEGGMPAMEAIKAATINAADLLGMKATLGSIEKGKLADIIAVEGNPLQDTNAFGRVTFVMKDGEIYKGEKYVQL